METKEVQAARATQAARRRNAKQHIKANMQISRRCTCSDRLLSVYIERNEWVMDIGRKVV